jgi:hypothetical protein
VAPLADATQQAALPLVVEFTDSGKAILYSQGTSIDLEYQFLSDTSINIPIASSLGFTSNVWTFTVVRDQLVLDVGGEQKTFNRTP